MIHENLLKNSMMQLDMCAYVPIILRRSCYFFSFLNFVFEYFEDTNILILNVDEYVVFEVVGHG